MDERQGVFCVGTLETSCFAFWDQVASLLGIVYATAQPERRAFLPGSFTMQSQIESLKQ